LQLIFELLVLLNQFRHFQVHQLHHLLVLVNQRFIVVRLGVVLLEYTRRQVGFAGELIRGQGGVETQRAFGRLHGDGDVDCVW